MACWTLRQPRASDLSTSTGQFSDELTKVLDASHTGNALVSPVSLLTCLSMVLAGSKGHTLDKLKSVLKLPSDISQDEIGDQARVQALTSPYHDEIAMVILLPTESLSVNTLFGEEAVCSIAQQVISNGRRTGIDFFMPKFKFDANISMNQLLHSLGAGDLFQSPDLSGMTDSLKLRVSEITHATAIEVDEEGTKSSCRHDGRIWANMRSTTQFKYRTRSSFCFCHLWSIERSQSFRRKVERSRFSLLIHHWSMFFKVAPSAFLPLILLQIIMSISPVSQSLCAEKYQYALLSRN